MSELPTLSIHTDGASRGNPGDAAFGYVIEVEGEDTIEDGGCLAKMTNNQAEYTAVLRVLRHALLLGAEHNIVLHSDSLLLVNQMKGTYKVKNADLRGLYEQAQALVARFTGTVQFKHVRREFNKRADALCNEALDGLRVSEHPEVDRDPPAESGKPPQRSTTSSKPNKPNKAKSTGMLRRKAIELLEEVRSLWLDGEDENSAEGIWEKLALLITRHGGTLPAEE